MKSIDSIETIFKEKGFLVRLISIYKGFLALLMREEATHTLVASAFSLINRPTPNQFENVIQHLQQDVIEELT